MPQERIADELPLAMATETLCINQDPSLFSPVIWVILLPTSLRNNVVLGPVTPEDSTATGSNRYLSVKPAYFSRFRSSTALAVEPGQTAEFNSDVWLYVSTHVASQHRR